MNDFDANTLRERHPTGVELIDQALDGGPLAGSVNGILGESGTGRTRLAMMLAAEGALKAFQAHLYGDSVCRWFVAVGNGEIADRRRYAIEHLSGLDFEVAARVLRSIPHEERFAKAVEGVHAGSGASFTQRVAAAFHVAINFINYWNLKWPRAREALTAVHPVFRAAGFPETVAGVVIDEFRDLVFDFEDRYPSRIGIEPYVNALISCSRYARTYRTIFWIVHLIQVEAERYLPEADVSHRQSVGYRQFGAHLDSCFVFGARDENYRFQLHCTKRPGTREPFRAVAEFARNGSIIPSTEPIVPSVIRRRPGERVIDVAEGLAEFLLDPAACDPTTFPVASGAMNDPAPAKASKRKRRSREEIRNLLSQIEAIVGAGKLRSDALRALDVDQATYRRWTVKYGTPASLQEGVAEADPCAMSQQSASASGGDA